MTEALAEAGLAWLLGQARDGAHGPAWADPGDAADANPSLYSGTAGVVITLLEAYRHFGDDVYADVARRAARTLAHAVDSEPNCSLYFGLTGVAVALHAVAGALDDPASDRAARLALDVVRRRFDGVRWGEQFELLGGNAGVALGALAIGDLALAELAVGPYLDSAEPTKHGVHWQVRLATPARFHHISHGTLGIVQALAAVGHASGDTELLQVACAGAADVVGRNEAGDEGFLVPHSDPQHRPELIERYSYGWCHGPAGDAQVFRQLAAITRDASWDGLIDGCWHTVVRSGLPQRLRPGFWDNSGRCCGTAGVLALACDRLAAGHDAEGFAADLVDDLVVRATVDAAGARWCNYEHRAEQPWLAPLSGWAMGNAGIVRELLRYARLRDGRDPSYAVPWPDQPGPDGLLAAGDTATAPTQ